MKKSDSIRIFGNQKSMAAALGIGRSAVSHIPEDMPQKKQDEIIGAAIRLDLPVPDDVMQRFKARGPAIN